ncbi:retrovirus-related pol polyprotein from transposon TNT 1-94 [Tanacetum coccineum]
MAALKFADTHNMVAFLEKPTESAGFEEIVDFLNAHFIRYALTHNPTIYVSCIDQFWSTAKTKTINKETHIHALVDGKKIVITKSSVRRDLQLADEEGQPIDPQHTPISDQPSITEQIIAQSSHQPKKTHKPRKPKSKAIPSSEQSNVVNHSETEITSDSNIIPYSQYLIELQLPAVQNSNSSTQQDAQILSVIEQLKIQVANCTKINLENKNVNDTLTAKLERYKEQVKVLNEGQNVDLRSNDNVSDSSAQSVEIDRLKQTLSEHLKEKESLMQTVSFLKDDLKKEESRNIDREVALEKRIKQLDNINSVISTEPTLSRRPTIVEVPKDLPKVSMVNTSLKKLKHHLAGFDVVVKERTTPTAIIEGSWVQNVFHQMEQAVEQHLLESKTFEVKMNHVLNENERLLEQGISKDIVNILVNSSVNIASVNVHECEKCLKLETELLNKKDFIEKEIYDKLFKRLGHNLFSVGQFCDSNLEVSFRQHTCFIRNLEGVDLLTGSQGNYLYTLSLGDMMTSSPICLLSKASKTKSWLWHRRLSHLNFGEIYHLARHGLVRGLPKLKFEKDHLCSNYAMGKSKKKPHKPKSKERQPRKYSAVATHESFALVARLEAIRIFLAFAAAHDSGRIQMDVKSAFKMVFYGKRLKQAPRPWYDMLSSFLISQDFSKGSVDPTLFICREGKELLLVQIYVNDIIFAASTPKLWNLFAKIIFDSCDPVDTPKVEKSKLDDDKEGKAVDPSHYHGMIGTLLYLTASRPDLQFEICMCAWYQARLIEKHLHAVKRIFQYPRGTVNQGLWYPKNSSIALTAFADADHAGCQDTRHSTSGSMQFLGDRLVSWSSKRQKSATISDTEAEYIAMSKHIDIKFHFINELVENGVIKLYFVKTEYQLADIFTKALCRERIKFLINKLGMRSFTPETLKQLADEAEE